MKTAKGITLIELVVASSLMGLLFFSGLQMLSTIFSVQSAVMKPSSGTSWDRVRLETHLRSQLQDASQLDILDSGKTLRYDNTRLRFQQNQACRQWVLLSQVEDRKPYEIFHWSSSRLARNQKFAFVWDQDTPQLLNVFLGQAEPSLSIWLRNQP